MTNGYEHQGVNVAGSVSHAAAVCVKLIATQNHILLFLIQL